MENRILFLWLFCIGITYISFGQNLPDIPTEDAINPPSPTASGLGKYGDYQVSKSNGTVPISIPIHTLKSKKLSLPISLSYHSGGIRVSDRAPWVGLGWSLNAGGVITRTVKGLPDELGNGYLEQTIPIIGSDGYIDRDDISELCQFANWKNGLIDGEPDIFHFNFAGYSGKFLLDPEMEAQTFPHTDLSIIPDFEDNSFLVITPDGNRFIFSETESTQMGNASSVVTAWYLTRIEEPNGDDQITLKYRDIGDLVYLNAPISTEYLNFLDPSATGYTRETRPSDGAADQRVFGAKRIKTIEYTGGKIEFKVVGTRLDCPSDPRLDIIEIWGVKSILKSYKLDYDYFISPHSTYNRGENIPKVEHTHRLKLMSVTERGDNEESIPPYILTYHPTSLPPINSTAQDFWGFYNGQHNNQTLIPHYSRVGGDNMIIKMGNANRTADKQLMLAGSLQSITYPTGGSTEFFFELNDFQLKTPIYNFEQRNKSVDVNTTVLSGSELREIVISDEIPFDKEIENYKELMLCYGVNIPEEVQENTFSIKLVVEQINTSNQVISTHLSEYFKDTYHTNDCGQSIPLSPSINAIRMTIKVTAQNTFKDFEQSLINQLSGSIKVLWEERVSDEPIWNVPVGGLRIKSLITNPLQGPSIEKQYYYKEADSDLSSGKLNHDFTSATIFDFAKTYVRNWKTRTLSPQGPCSIAPDMEHMSITESPVTSLGVSSNSPVTYTRVEEVVGADNGRSIYEYSYLSDSFYSGLGAFADVLIDNTWNRGYLLKETHIDADEKELSSTLHHYEDIALPTTIRGVLVGERWTSLVPANGRAEYCLPIEALRKEVGLTCGHCPVDLNSDCIDNTKIIEELRGKLSATTFTYQPIWKQLQWTRQQVDGVETQTTYKYAPIPTTNNPNSHTNPIVTSTKNSDNKIHKLEVKYAREANITCLLDKHIINVPIETRKYVNEVFQGAVKTNYQLFNEEKLCLPQKTYRLFKPTNNEVELPKGDSIVYQEYTIDGFPRKTKKMGFPSKTYKWEAGLLLEVNQSNHFITSYTYNKNSRLLETMMDIDKQIITYDYDSFQRLNSISERNNNRITTINYDFLYELGSRSNATDNRISTTVTYKDAPTQVSTQTFDGLGRARKTIHNDILKNEIIYDALGRIEKQTYLPGNFTTLKYDNSPLNRVMEEIYPDGNSRTTNYTSENNYYKQNITDENGHTTSTLTDILGRTYKMVNAEGASTIYEYGDDRVNLPTKIIPPNGDSPAYTYHYTYDKRNRPETKTLPQGGITTYTYYDETDLMYTSTDARGFITTYEYDDYGREELKYIEGPNRPKTRICKNIYDRDGGINIGKLTEKITSDLSDGTLYTKTLTYDDFGRLWTTTSNNHTEGGREVYQYSYNHADWLLTEDRKHNTNTIGFNVGMGYTYDNFGRIENTIHSLGGQAQIISDNTWNNRDQLIQKIVGDGLQVVDYEYNERGWLKSINKPLVTFPGPTPACTEVVFPAFRTDLDKVLEELETDIFCDQTDVTVEDFLRDRFESTLNWNCYQPCQTTTSVHSQLDCSGSASMASYNLAVDMMQQEYSNQIDRTCADGKEQSFSEVDLSNIIYPLTVYRLQFCEGKEIHVTAKVLGELTGQFITLQSLQITDENQRIAVKDASGITRYMTIEELLSTILQYPEQDIYLNDFLPSSAPCTPVPFDCNEEEREEQEAYIKAIQQNNQYQDRDRLVMPAVFHRVLLCDETEIHLHANEIENLPGTYSILQDIVIESKDQSLTYGNNFSGEDLQDLFYLGLHYDKGVQPPIVNTSDQVDPNRNVKAQKNGNITWQDWQVYGDNRKAYVYNYDPLDRLTKARHFGVSPGNSFYALDFYNVEEIIYDKNGNIDKLHRMGRGDAFCPSDMDILDFKLNGNQIESVTDAGNVDMGFKARSGAGMFRYDDSGNMIYDPHKQASIDYNYLNLPYEISFEAGNTSTQPNEPTSNEPTPTTNETITDPLFAKYEWLSDIVDQQTCSVTKVTEYKTSIYRYVLVEQATGNVLYNAEGRRWCADRAGLNCTQSYGLEQTGEEWICGTTTSIPTTNEPETAPLIDEYPWLSALIDRSTCEITKVTEYETGIYKYLLLEQATENVLYNGGGDRWCADRADLNCTESYGLIQTGRVWICGADNSTTPTNEGTTDSGSTSSTNETTTGTSPGIKQILYRYDTEGNKLAKEIKGNSEESYIQNYFNGIEYGGPKGETLEAIYHSEGRVVRVGDKWEYEYFLKDHLGNTRVVFKKDEEGKATILDQTHYYPFGMEMEGSWSHTSVDPENNYLYNGKELDSDFGLDWYHYGARMYDSTIGRFTGVDPISDQFAWVSTYNYAENSPIANIDLHGLQKVSVNDVRNEQGKITSRNVNVSVKMKVLNLSSKDNFQFNNSLNRAKGRASTYLSTSFNSRVLNSVETGLTSNEVPVNVKFSLSTQQVTSLDQVSNSDFVGIIVDAVDNQDEGGNTEGWGEISGNVTILEADQMDGSSSELLLHELGHNLSLDHTDNGEGLMGANMNGRYNIDKSVLKDLYQGMPVTGEPRQIQHSNTKGRAKDFLKTHGTSYDKTKARKAGFD